MVEALLPAVLRKEFTVMPILNLGKTGKPPAPSEGGNMMAMMVEIDNAYSKLSTEDRVVLFLKYAESFDYAGIASEMELGSEDAARMRHNRAIKKLITRLGGFKPYLDKESSDEPHEVVESDDEQDYSERDEESENVTQ